MVSLAVQGVWAPQVLFNCCATMVLHGGGAACLFTCTSVLC